jgi:hypothetical protein
LSDSQRTDGGIESTLTALLACRTQHERCNARSGTTPGRPVPLATDTGRKCSVTLYWFVSNDSPLTSMNSVGTTCSGNGDTDRVTDSDDAV